MTEVKPGQLWKENSDYTQEFKKVLEVGASGVRIISCDEAGNTIINPHTGKAAPRRFVKPERFDGRPGGYSLFKDA